MLNKLLVLIQRKEYLNDFISAHNSTWGNQMKLDTYTKATSILHDQALTWDEKTTKLFVECGICTEEYYDWDYIQLWRFVTAHHQQRDELLV